MEREKAGKQTSSKSNDVHTPSFTVRKLRPEGDVHIYFWSVSRVTDQVSSCTSFCNDSYLIAWVFHGSRWVTWAICKGALWHSSFLNRYNTHSLMTESAVSPISCQSLQNHVNKQSLTTLFPCYDLLTSPATSNLTSPGAASMLFESAGLSGTRPPGLLWELWVWALETLGCDWCSKNSAALGLRTSFQLCPFLSLTTSYSGIKKILIVINVNFKAHNCPLYSGMFHSNGQH